MLHGVARPAFMLNASSAAICPGESIMSRRVALDPSSTEMDCKSSILSTPQGNPYSICVLMGQLPRAPPLAEIDETEPHILNQTLLH